MSSWIGGAGAVATDAYRHWTMDWPLFVAARVRNWRLAMRNRGGIGLQCDGRGDA
jgi:hypothetical protein